MDLPAKKLGNCCRGLHQCIQWLNGEFVDIKLSGKIYV